LRRTVAEVGITGVVVGLGVAVGGTGVGTGVGVLVGGTAVGVGVTVGNAACTMAATVASILIVGAGLGVGAGVSVGTSVGVGTGACVAQASAMMPEVSSTSTKGRSCMYPTGGFIAPF
jgi:hypothetical protein